MILHIAVNKPLYHLFDYLLPPEIDIATLRPGMRVLVPFGTRQMIGVFLEVASSSAIDVDKLKPINSILDQEPILSEQLLQLYFWVSEYYHHPIGEVILGHSAKIITPRQEGFRI